VASRNFSVAQRILANSITTPEVTSGADKVASSKSPSLK
jgi:hypothetical protein